jgi:hypothetical protein
VGFVDDEVKAATNSPPFTLEDTPGGLGGGRDLFGSGLARAPFRGEIGMFVFDEGADQPQVARGSAASVRSSLALRWRHS